MKHIGSIAGIYKTLHKVYGPQRWWPADTQLEMMVGAILTQNTAWKNVEKAMCRLRDAGALGSVAKFSALSRSRLAGLIRPAGYYNIKARRLKNLVSMIMSDYGGGIDLMAHEKTQALREKLLSVNGIGPETRDSILLYAFRRPVFVVDTYTKRIFSRHGFVREGDSYDLVQAIFASNLPCRTKMFNEYHALIVRLAKDHCRTKAKCEKCPLKNML